MLLTVDEAADGQRPVAHAEHRIAELLRQSAPGCDKLALYATRRRGAALAAREPVEFLGRR